MSRKRINVTETFLPPHDEYEAIVQQLWSSKWLTNRGELILSLEEKLHNYLSTKEKPLLVNNGTIALQIPLKAMDLQGEIITTPFSYVATTATIVWENCTPVFVDIDPEYLTIDETKIEEAITDNTTAILAVHVYGNPCAVEAIEQIADKYGLAVIYDAAHCFGVKYKERSLFDYGDISTCSYHATKLFHTGEGGAIYCNNSSLAEKVYYHHNFGHDGPEKFHGLGINAKMSELNAAMGMALLPHMDKVLQRRKEISEQYDRLLKWDILRKPTIREHTTYNYAYYPVLFDSEENLLKTKKALEIENIFARRYFYPSLNTLPYLVSCNMPVSEDISPRVLCLPLFVDLEDNDVDFICKIVNSVV